MHVITNLMIVEAMLVAVQDGRLQNCDKQGRWHSMDAKYIDPLTGCRCAIGAALPPDVAGKIIAYDLNTGTVPAVDWGFLGVSFEDPAFANEMQLIHDLQCPPPHWESPSLLGEAVEPLIGKPAIGARFRLGRKDKTTAWWTEFLGLVKQHLETPA